MQVYLPFIMFSIIQLTEQMSEKKKLKNVSNCASFVETSSGLSMEVEHLLLEDVISEDEDELREHLLTSMEPLGGDHGVADAIAAICFLPLIHPGGRRHSAGMPKHQPGVTPACRFNTSKASVCLQG